MAACNEKSGSVVTDGSDDIQRLKSNLEQNASLLSTLEKGFQGLYQTSQRQDHSSSLRKVLQLIKNAPLNVLRRLSKRLKSRTRELLTKLQQRIWPVPRVVVGDHILFEDALGRKSNLTISYYMCWTVFKPYIDHSFKDLPGQYQVLRSQFRLTNERTGQSVDKTNWKDLMQADERITMSVISTIPFGPHSERACPACNLISHDNRLIDENIMCPCGSMFKVSVTPTYHYVVPSDGNCEAIPMLEQKRSDKRRESAKKSLQDYGMLSVGDEFTGEEHLSDFEVDVNHGLSQLKHITVQPTQDPIEIADAISDLLSEINTIAKESNRSDDPDILHAQHPMSRRLKSTLYHIRNEARRTDELNYFDFKSEHETFMVLARNVTSHLHTHVQTLRATTPSPPTFAPLTPIKKLTTWVENHAGPPSNIPTNPTDPFVPYWDNTKPSTLVILKTLNSQSRCFRTLHTQTILQLKETITKHQGLPVAQQYLVYQGKKLEDHRTVGDYGIGPQYYVHVLLPIWSRK